MEGSNAKAKEVIMRKQEPLKKTD